MHAEKWSLHLMCMEWAQRIQIPNHASLLLHFPEGFKTVSSLRCGAVSEVSELGAVGRPIECCACHQEPVKVLKPGTSLDALRDPFYLSVLEIPAGLCRSHRTQS